MIRMAAARSSLEEVEELLEEACYAIDLRLPDAQRRSESAIERALPMIRRLTEAAKADAEAALFEEMEDDEEESV